MDPEYDRINLTIDAYGYEEWLKKDQNPAGNTTHASSRRWWKKKKNENLNSKLLIKLPVLWAQKKSK